jgi:ketosteroid isomerase-like protein
MDRNEIEAFVRTLYAARVGGDMQALGRAFAGNARFQIAGSPEVSMVATVIEGHDGVMALMQTMVDTFVLEDFAILDLVIDGNKAAVRWRATIHQGASGQTFTTELADFIEIADGKVVSFIEFLDTALAG